MAGFIFSALSKDHDVKERKNTLRPLLLILFFFPVLGFSQSDTTDIYELSFMELARLKIVSASKVSQDISEVSSTVFVLTALEIEQRGYQTLEDVLGDMPGFQFRNIQSINSYVFQRGIPNQNNLTLILIDGVQVNELNSGGFYAGGQYNLSNVERIEVIHGPSSVAYGTNAVSGIINIITREHDENRVAVSTLAGSFNTLKSDFGYTWLHDSRPLSLSVSGMVKTTDRSDLRGRAGDYNWSDLMDNFERNYALDLKIKSGKFTLGSNYLHKQASGAAYVKSTGTTYRDHGTLWNLRFINSYLKYSHSISNKLKFSSLLYNRNSTVLPNSVLYITDETQIGYYRPNYLVGLENILDYHLSRVFSFASGLVFEYEQLAESYAISYSESPEKRPALPSDPKMISNTLASIFLEPRLNPVKGLYLSGGVRFDHSSIYDQVFTPRFGISYHLRNHMARVSYAEAFRAPKPWDYYDGLGNASLLPERMRSHEAALSLLITETLKADISAYKNSLEDAIVRQEVEGGYHWVNRGLIDTRGLEVSLLHLSPRLNTYLNYTFNDSRDKNKDAIPEISKHSGNAGITYMPGSKIAMHIRANYAGERENPKVIKTTGNKFVDPFVVFHASLTYKDFYGFDLQATIGNILNKEYYHTSNRDPDRYRQPQRTLLLSIAYKNRY